MNKYLIMETLHSKKPAILFYSRAYKKWYEDCFLGDVQEVLKKGKRTKILGMECIKFK